MCNCRSRDAAVIRQTINAPVVSFPQKWVKPKNVTLLMYAAFLLRLREGSNGGSDDLQDGQAA